ncbi:MAG: CDP-glycerol glycerophosphotransferase family protein [Treponema sp.]|jgi:hypothetical protein|nr:CDP-glycerol glycerophosphotransferase family protein [Treponema sp.]
MMHLDFYRLYIDPGTGSMLFSILLGIAATLYFLARALLIKAKVIFSGGGVAVKSAVAQPYVIYSEGKHYWNVFKPVLDEFEKRQQEITFLTSSEDDPVFEQHYRLVKPEFIGEGNKAFARLNFLSADVVLMTTPGLQVYQLKRSQSVNHYAHVLHAPGDATLYRMFGIDYFDSVLLTGDYQAKDIRALEQLRGLPEKQLITVGCTYLDEYAETLRHLPKEAAHPFTVLVSPSWGPSALLRKYGCTLLDPLVKTGWRIIIRPHPQSKISETSMLESLRETYKHASHVLWDYERENIYSLAKADMMISDFSGIIFDYMFLFDKPVMYVKQGLDLRPYDADDLGDKAADALWQFKTLHEAGIELQEAWFDSIGEVIKNASDSRALKTARDKAKSTAWQFQGEAGKRIADFMMDHTREHKH